MVKICIFDGCTTLASFNYEGETKRLYCKEHAKENMRDVKNKTCIFDGCTKQPSFNYEGEKKGIYCAEHAKENMRDVKNKTCIFDGCTKQPRFNYVGEKKGIYCSEHAKENMRNVANKTCIFDGCTKQPCFNYVGEKKGIYCSEHAKENMRDIKNKTCIFDGCTKQPSFNYEGETKRLYCAEHAKENMRNMKKTCIFSNCETQAKFGMIGNKPVHCALHADRRIEVIHPMKRCSTSNCRELATHGITKPIHCANHSQEDEKDFVTTVCPSCCLPAIIYPNGLCYFCDPERAKTVRLAKQKTVYDFLKHHFEIESYDKIIDSKCGLERPDIIINSDSGCFKIDVEVDEGQHKGRPEECECIRMRNISESYHMPTLFVRYNPDEYKTTDNEQVSERKRLERLKKVIQECKEYERINCVVGIIKLYFDGWKESDPVDITIVSTE
jgi:EsV-1-7 cysteine-rich motif